MLTFTSSVKSKTNNNKLHNHGHIKHENKYNTLWFLWCCF